MGLPICQCAHDQDHHMPTTKQVDVTKQSSESGAAYHVAYLPLKSNVTKDCQR